MSKDDGDLVRARLSPAMVSPDNGQHWYEVPDGMEPHEFMTRLLLGETLDPA